MSLNEKQKAFCEYYAACFNATEAAAKAGYSSKTAYSIGQRLLKNVETKNYIREITVANKSQRIATIDEVLEYLTSTMRNSEVQIKERTRAAQLLSEALKTHSENVDRTVTEITVISEDASEGENGEFSD